MDASVFERDMHVVEYVQCSEILAHVRKSHKAGSVGLFFLEARIVFVHDGSFASGLKARGQALFGRRVFGLASECLGD